MSVNSVLRFHRCGCAIKVLQPGIINGKTDFDQQILNDKKNVFWAVVVGHFVEHLFQKPEIRGLNQVIGKLYLP